MRKIYFRLKCNFSKHFKIFFENKRPFEFVQHSVKLKCQRIWDLLIECFHKRLGQHLCSVGMRVFGMKGGLSSHIKLVHENMKPFKCDKCPIQFKSQVALKRHVLCVHEKLRLHPCPECKNEFGYQETLQAHFKYVHENVRPFICDLCHP